MRYILCPPFLGDFPEVEIDEADYWALIEAKKVLFGCLSIEKKYEILLSNYLEFEQQILHVTASRMIRNFPPSVYEARLMIDLDVRLMMDLRLVNLLTSARLYLDHLPGHMKECMPRESYTTCPVGSLSKVEHKSKPEYRFMEALRNHVQHRGLAVHLVRLPTRWTRIDEEDLLEFSLGIMSLKSELKTDKKFKKQVLNEIPDEVDLKLATRCYIESLSNIHIEIRKLIANSVSQSRRKIEDAFCKYQEESKQDVKMLQVVQIRGEEIVESDSLFLEGDDIRKKLQERNGQLSNLYKCFATNK